VWGEVTRIWRKTMIGNKERNKTDNETAKDNNNKEASIRGSGFPVPSPDGNSEGGIGSAIGESLLIDS
jgi:hypothetical protein